MSKSEVLQLSRTTALHTCGICDYRQGSHVCAIGQEKEEEEEEEEEDEGGLQQEQHHEQTATEKLRSSLIPPTRRTCDKLQCNQNGSASWSASTLPARTPCVG